ncbi:ASST-domain-containing protein [Aspergillus egyptiacus]|nr:ASST-domain-containing protein [Aspergillus egyptiacus]
MYPPTGSSFFGRHRHRLKNGNARLSMLHVLMAATALSLAYLFYVFAVPHLLRFRFRRGLSWYDWGVYGFGPTRGYESFGFEAPVFEFVPVDKDGNQQEDDDGAGCDPRYTFLAPRGNAIAHPGPMIFDAQGELVWLKRNWEKTQDFKVQRYRGEDYLTYWEGRQDNDCPAGAWYMIDSTYTLRYEVHPVGDYYGGDLHEFNITPEGTALVTVNDPIPSDLRPIGGPEVGWILDAIFQELDLATGDLIFEWRASDHFPVNSTYESLPPGATGRARVSPFDAFHINSVDKDEHGNYIISMRHTHTVSCISKDTGAILWTLGGKTNDFRDLSNGTATNFAWQHDARWHAPNSILTLFDNEAHSRDDPSDRESRGMSIYLDTAAREATLMAEYFHPHQMRSVSQGNVQVLDDDSGRVLVGWGHSAAFSEFTSDGRLTCNVHFGASALFDFGRVVSYRAFKGDWVGRPQTRPDAVIVNDTIYVSWNGATEVAAWQLETWSSSSSSSSSTEHQSGDVTVVTTLAKTGFETEIAIPDELEGGHILLRLAALDREGGVLGVTDPLQRNSGASLADLATAHSLIVLMAFVTSLGGLVAVGYRLGCSGGRRRRFPWLWKDYELIPLHENEGRS